VRPLRVSLGTRDGCDLTKAGDCHDRSLNPTATAALPARLSVTSPSRATDFRVAMRGWKLVRGGKWSVGRSNCPGAVG